MFGKRIKHLLMVLFLFLSLFLTSTGYSEWEIAARNAGGNAAADSATSTFYSVQIKYITTQLGAATSTQASSTSSTDTTSTAYNTYNGKTPVVVSDVLSAKTATAITNGTTYTWTETKKTCTASSRSGNWLFGYSYSTTFVTVVYNWTQTETRTVDSSNIYSTFSAKSGSCISKPSLSRSGYVFSRYLAADSTGNNTTNKDFDFSKPITANTVVFAEWYAPSDSTVSSTSALASYVNSITTASTKNIFVGGTDFNISTDKSYSNTTGEVNLGSPSLATTVASGVTINFCMTSGKTNVVGSENEKITSITEHENANDKFVSASYTGASPTNTPNTCDYCLVLQNDLTINGTMVVGGYTGGVNSATIMGYIIYDYVALDLNGHNVTVNNGGVLHSFGVIKDSVGTGRLLVNVGGNLKTQMVLLDMKGGNNTIWQYAKDQCPFEDYSFPYLTCNVDIATSASSSGSLVVFTKMDLGTLGVSNFYISFLGGTSSYLIKVLGANGNVNIKSQKISAISGGYIDYNLVNYRTKFTFSNVTATWNQIQPNANIYISKDVSIIGNIVLEQQFAINTARFNFPISSLVDLVFSDSIFILNQVLRFMPGSSLTMDSNSTLKLIFNSSATTIPEVTVSKTVLIITITKTVPASTKYLSGGISVIDSPAIKGSTTNYAKSCAWASYGMMSTSYATFWTLFSSPSINIYGNVDFASGNSANTFYTLSGKININTFSVNGGTKYYFNQANISSHLSGVYLNTYAMDFQLSDCYWFGTSDELQQANNDCAHARCSMFYARPLVSNDIAYILKTGTTSLMTGTYNFDTGIFTQSSNNATYCFTSNTYLLQSSNGSQDNALDSTVNINQCTVNSATNSVSIGSQAYIFALGLMLSATVTSATAATANASKISSLSTDVTTYATHAFTYSGSQWRF